MKHITSAHNAELKHLAKLLDSARSRREHGQMVLEGYHLILAALQHGLVPQGIWLTQSQLGHPEALQITEAVGAHAVRSVDDEVFGKFSRAYTGAPVLALCGYSQTMPQAESAEERGDAVLLDGIQDPGNAGTILRSAAAAGIGSVFFGKGCVDAFAPKVLRAGMGAHFALNLYPEAEVAQVLALFAGTVRTTVLDAKSRSLFAADLRTPGLWVFGSEGAGVGKAVLEAADECVYIPMSAAVESLNVAMAAGVCFYEQYRQRHPESA